MILEHYAEELFDAWSIESNGMLLVADFQNEDAHITLGKDWNETSQRQARKIIETLVTPCLNKGNLLKGLLYGAKGLDAIPSDLSHQ